MITSKYAWVIYWFMRVLNDAFFKVSFYHIGKHILVQHKIAKYIIIYFGL